MRTSSFLILVAAVLALVVVYTAQAHRSANPYEFDFSRTPINFLTSCAPATRQNFNRALGLLHLFWYDAAQGYFTNVRQVDPNCTIAWWGVAMTYWQQLQSVPTDAELQAGWNAISMATDPVRMANASPRERQYASALKAFYLNWNTTSHEQRVLNYEKEMQNLYTSYGSADPEAALFYSLAILARTTTFGHQKQVGWKDNRRAGNMIELVLASHPKHPGAMHYLMHAYNNPTLAPMAKEVALAYEESDELFHYRPMSFRIFTRLGMWEELFTRAAEQMEAFTGPTLKAPPVAETNPFPESNPIWFPSPVTPDSLSDQWIDAAAYYHYACLQRALDDEANYLVNNIVLRRNLSNPGSLTASWQYVGILARHYEDLEAWDTLLRIQYVGSIPANPRENLLIAYSRILGASRANRADMRFILRDAANTVAEANKTLVAWPQWRQLTNLQKTEIYGLMGSALAWRNYADGDILEAMNLLEQTAVLLDSFYPPTLPIASPLEQIGDMYTMNGKLADAAVAYERSLQVHPRRFPATYGVGLGYQSLHDDWNTTLWFNRLTAQCGRPPCFTRKYMRTVDQYLIDLSSQLRMDGWGLFFILAGGAFIAVTVAGAVALHYRENPVWGDFLS